jgi:lysophospholipase L1-like esterase
MKARRSRSYGLCASLVIAAVAAALLLGGGSSQAASGHPYLALGDSVGFGYITQAGFEYGNANNFVGFPDYVAPALGFQEANASCPGEATTGFISVTGADNGCRPYKAAFPLHVAYSGTQLAFATTFLEAHPNTGLVTLQLGANDAFLLEKSCAGVATCIAAGLPALLAQISANIDTILRDLKATRFHGLLMIVNYYSLDYSDAAGTALTEALNLAITSHAQADGAVVADAFSAFQQAAATAGGKTCNAGLLNASPQNQFTCDVHPSQSGQKLLAQTVDNEYQAATGG